MQPIPQNEVTPNRRNIVTHVLEHARTHPDRNAIISDEWQLDYRELASLILDAASIMRRSGISCATRVGVVFRRSAELLVGLLAAMAAGGVCVPLDVGYPTSRLEYLKNDAATDYLIGLPSDLSRFNGVTIVARHGVLGIARDTSERWSMPRMPAGLAYIVHTSGSTGRPKGVMMGHRQLAAFRRWIAKAESPGEAPTTLHLAPLCSDMSFMEIIATLCNGGTLVMCSEADRRDPSQLWKVIIRHRLDRIFVPFVLLQALAMVFPLEEGAARSCLTQVICAGEQLQCTTAVRDMFRRMPSARLVNLYGSTECLVATTYKLAKEVGSWPAVAPIGTMIDGTHAHLIPVPSIAGMDGKVMGELVVAGEQIAEGYWNRPQETRAQFIPDPCGTGAAYRTGDVVAEDAPGNLQFVGRIGDGQTKVRGVRIDLAEVEVVLNSVPGVAEAAVYVDGTDSLDMHVVAVVVPKAPDLPRQEVLRWLRDQLPEHCVPSRVRFAGALSRTPSGKLDRSALPGLSGPG